MGVQKKTRKFAQRDERVKNPPASAKEEKPKDELTTQAPQAPSNMFFTANTALGPPYHVLVDTNFVSHAIRTKQDLLTSMMDLLYAKCIPTFTDCTIAELEKLGDKFRLALRMAKDPRWERVRCSHSGTYADDCIVDRITKHRIYIVATNDKDLVRRIRKIPAGVLGLTTALRLQQETQRTQQVLIVAKDFPNTTSLNYASPWAGAHYRPVPGSTPQAVREEKQAQQTYKHFKTVAAQEPGAGVQIVDGVEHLENPPAEYLDPENIRNAYAHLDGFRQLTAEECPAPTKWGVQYKSVAVNSPVYCAWLLRQFVLKGGQTKEYTLGDVMEAFHMAGNVKTVVNCSGMGFGDPKSFIIRGQTCLVRNPCTMTLTRQNTDGSWSFCIPRPLGGGTIIGGTKQPRDWDPHPSPQTRETLLANAAKWFPFTAESGGKFDVIRDIVGRRPAREGGMRIEAERVGEGKVVVHAYGAGGRGFELSWGVAGDVLDIVQGNGLLQRASL
ncbi:Fcf1-domain-containing protein [Aspergillus candidus]|uniref:Fcf1-domain-containing protein n=1 Tax=Aspergillus candidus TaxID=41067 RepID=A0A2I2F5I8_ASPCN|nr:Fcf1-domain-containing protein [Aspergillus candidus]PLB35912.1 Fcf1-domain-containing protein [Aspergillus candidus]